MLNKSEINDVLVLLNKHTDKEETHTLAGLGKLIIDDHYYGLDYEECPRLILDDKHRIEILKAAFDDLPFLCPLPDYARSYDFYNNCLEYIASNYRKGFLRVIHITYANKEPLTFKGKIITAYELHCRSEQLIDGNSIIFNTWRLLERNPYGLLIDKLRNKYQVIALPKASAIEDNNNLLIRKLQSVFS